MKLHYTVHFIHELKRAIYKVYSAVCFSVKENWPVVERIL